MADEIKNPGSSPTNPPQADGGAADLEAKIAELTSQLEETKRIKGSANKEAAGYRHRAEEAEAKLKAAEDAQKSEIQKALDKATAESARADKAEREAHAFRRQSVVLEAGANPSYSKVIADNLGAELAVNPDLDVKAWLDGQKKSLPALFGQAQTPAPGSGNAVPPPASGGKKQAMAEELKLIESKLIPEAKAARNGDEILNLHRIRNTLRTELGLPVTL